MVFSSRTSRQYYNRNHYHKVCATSHVPAVPTGVPLLLLITCKTGRHGMAAAKTDPPLSYTAPCVHPALQGTLQLATGPPPLASWYLYGNLLMPQPKTSLLQAWPHPPDSSALSGGLKNTLGTLNMLTMVSASAPQPIAAPAVGTSRNNRHTNTQLQYSYNNWLS